MVTPSFSISINPHPESIELGVLFAGHSQTKPVHELGPQVLDYYLIHHILSGKGCFECKNETYLLGPGDSFVIFPNELVSYRSDDKDPWKYRWVAFKGTQSNSLLHRIGVSPSQPCSISMQPRRCGTLFYQLEKSLQKSGPTSDLESGGLLRLILAEYHTVQSPPQKIKISEAERQVDKAVQWLQLQYSRSISIEEMAQNLGYHRTYLAKIFKIHTGMSPIQYLLKIRMERAAYLLVQDSLTIQQVAASVGYPDALYFSKQFKKWHGVPPSEYAGKQK
jgi:AraC-like DNA-binding protein